MCVIDHLLYSNLGDFALIGSAQAFARRACYASDLSYNDVRHRFNALPTHMLPLLESAVGWRVIADAIGIDYSPAVH